MSTILLVDDEAPNRALIRAYLAGSGHTIVDANNGARALELADKIAPDLVLCDMLMPGVDGLELTRRLKSVRREVFLPIVLVTALADELTRRRAAAAGADDFLSKPVDPKELAVRVRDLLARRERQLAAAQKR